MKIITKRLSLPVSFPRSFPRQTDDLLFFDLETTGLSWRTSHLCIIGAIYKKESCWMMTQIFLDSPLEEQQALETFSELLSEKKCLIHYNGTSFDLPYLTGKFQLCQLSSPLSYMESLDLYRILTPLKTVFSLEQMRQKDLEALTGFLRNDALSGKDIGHQYKKYVETGKEILRRQILLHNEEDLMGMTAILTLLPLLDLFLLPQSGHLSAQTEDCAVFTIDTDVQSPKPFRCHFGLYQLSYEQSLFLLSVPVQHAALKYFFSDYQNYYYLPDEDTAIHKSLGCYVDRNHRKKATAATCFQKKEGVFLPAPKNFSRLPLFFSEYRERPAYVLLSELQSQAEAIDEYLTLILNQCVNS